MAQQNNQQVGGTNPYQRRGSHFAPSSDVNTTPQTTQQMPQGVVRPQGTRFATPQSGASSYSRAASSYARGAHGAAYGASSGPSNPGGGAPKKKGRGTVVAAVVLLIVGVALLAVALWFYLSAQHNYQQNKEEYDTLALNVTEDAVTNEPVVDFATLKAQNPEIVGWVQIPGTPVNYPVVQHADNDYYLNHSFLGRDDEFGAVFMDYRSRADLSNWNTVMYGHHLKNGEMFAKVADYSDQAEFDAIPGVYFVTEDGTVHDLVPIGAMVVDGAETDVLAFDFASQGDFLTYVQGLLDRCSARRSDVDLSGVRHLYMLSTCSYERDNDRTILLAVDRTQIGAAAHDATQDIEDIRSAADQAVDTATGE